jgi:hypothetical protein
MAREERCPSSLPVSETIPSQGAASLHAGGQKRGSRFAPVREDGHTRSDVGIDR